MPEPLEPSTATRSPYQTSRSNGFISPVSSSCSQIDGTLAGAAALEPHLDVLLARLARRRARLLELAQPRLRRLVARGHAVVVRRLVLVHQHQRLAAWRAPRPSAGAAPPGARTGPAAPRGTSRSRPDASTPCCLRRPSSTVTTRVAVLFISSRSWLTNRIVFGDSRIRSSSHSLPGTSRKLSGSSSSSTSSGPRSRASSTSRFCSPPLRAWRSRYFAPVVGRPPARRSCRRPRAPRCRSRRRRPTRPAPRRTASASSRPRRPSSPARPRSTAAAAARTRGGATRAAGRARSVPRRRARPSGASRRGRPTGSPHRRAGVSHR